MSPGSRTGAFVGRAAELATFAWAVDQARRGAPEVLLLSGDAGMGKSTLLHKPVAQSGVAASMRLCQEAVAVAPPVHARALAALYLVGALLDAACFDEAVTLALDTVAAGQPAGLDRSFGGYLSGMAAEALTGLGRWPEADTVLARFQGVDTIPVGTVRLARAGALLAARRGDVEAARSLLGRVLAQPVDPWHRILAQHTQAEVQLQLGGWVAALQVAEQGWQSCDQDRRWPARFAMIRTVAAVESALDAQARRERVDVDNLLNRLHSRIEEARAASRPPRGEPILQRRWPPSITPPPP